MKVDIRNLRLVYEEEIRKNVKNKKRTFDFELNKIEYLIDIKRLIESGLYNGGKYNIFLIYEPKVRVIMSQSIYDKIINHYITRFVLIPKLSKYLNDRNCATRKNMGITYAIKLLKRDIESFKKYDNFYFLKLDISKYFYNIDHEVLLNMVSNDLNEDEINIIKVILNSTNKEYINKVINKNQNKVNDYLPKYNYGKGLPIGNMTSQFLAIFYLSKLQHYISHNLHLKFINYMDDYIIIHQDKNYLKSCLEIITTKLKTEYKLDINKNKTYIVSCKDGVNFLGYKFKVINHKTIIKLSGNSKRNIKRGLKRVRYEYENNKIEFKTIFSSIENYKNSYPFVSRNEINHIINYYWY